MEGEDEDLTLIPRPVRDKLDRVGIKLHLREWELLELEERRSLVRQPCESDGEVRAYRARVVDLVAQRTGREPDRLSR